MPTAILIDGAFFIRRFRSIEPQNSRDPKRAAQCAHRWALAHLRDPVYGARNTSKAKPRDLYRIFFYDCAPVQKKMHHPITHKAIDFSKSEEATFRNALHDELRKKRKMALRLGHLSSQVDWTLRPSAIADLLKKTLSAEQIGEQHVTLNVRQKGVDMKIGLDISSLAIKKHVDQIVLIAGDADFVPAAKVARREGVDFVLDPMWKPIPTNLNEHIDGLRSTCKPPSKIQRVPE